MLDAWAALEARVLARDHHGIEERHQQTRTDATPKTINHLMDGAIGTLHGVNLTTDEATH